MPAFKDITGQTKGRLTAIRCTGRNKHGQAMWLFRCACDGKEIEAASYHFVSGHTTSCGCLIRELTAARNVRQRGEKSPMFGRRGKDAPYFKHGHGSRAAGISSTYSSWNAVVQRCANPNTIGWSHYGGAGVKVCDRWRNSFEAFLEDLGERPDGTTLGRFSDLGNYEPDNCAWQTRKEQQAEQKSKRQLVFLAA
jgi:hypothetical protein